VGAGGGEAGGFPKPEVAVLSAASEKTNNFVAETTKLILVPLFAILVFLFI